MAGGPPYYPHMGPVDGSKGPQRTPLKPLQLAELWPLSHKSALLLTLTSVKRVGDLQALSVSTSCFEVWPNDRKVILKPRHSYVPKVLYTLFRAHVFSLSALPNAEDVQELHLPCPVWALRVYTERSAQFSQSEQLFMCFGGHTKGHPVTKQRLSRWIVDIIILAYASMGHQCPIRCEGTLH